MISLVIAVIHVLAATLLYQISVCIVGISNAAPRRSLRNQLIERIVGIGGASFCDLHLLGRCICNGRQLPFYLRFFGDAAAGLIVAVFVCQFIPVFGDYPLALIIVFAINRTPLVLAISFPLLGWIRDFHPLETCAARHT